MWQLEQMQQTANTSPPPPPKKNTEGDQGNKYR
jgi:hypothetical protein